MSTRQRGVALLSVLLIMSLALLLTAGMLRTHHLTLQGAADQLHQMELRRLGFSGEALALQLLSDARLSDDKSVHLGQEWARRTMTFEIDGAHIDLHVEDLAGRFNLNHVFKAGQADDVMLERWTRLLMSQRIKPLAPPLMGSTLMDVSQLRLLPGVDGPAFQRLEPLIALLPKDASLNVNTASALLLATLEGVTPAVAENLARERPARGYRSAQDFTREPLLSAAGVNDLGLGVDSRWFRITVDATLGERRLRLSSDIERDMKTRQLSVVQRRLLPLPDHEPSP